jgi:hypothetical protein
VGDLRCWRDRVASPGSQTSLVSLPLSQMGQKQPRAWAGAQTLMQANPEGCGRPTVPSQPPAFSGHQGHSQDPPQPGGTNSVLLRWLQSLLWSRWPWAGAGLRPTA